MTRRYTYTTSLSFGGDEPTAEIEVEVSYGVAWGSPEGGNYGQPEDYDPGSPSVVEDVRVETIDGKPPTADHALALQHQAEAIIAALEDRHADEMLETASEAEEASEPDLYTAAKDRRMEEVR